MAVLEPQPCQSGIELGPAALAHDGVGGLGAPDLRIRLRDVDEVYEAPGSRQPFAARQGGKEAAVPSCIGLSERLGDGWRSAQPLRQARSHLGNAGERIRQIAICREHGGCSLRPTGAAPSRGDLRCEHAQHLWAIRVVHLGHPAPDVEVVAATESGLRRDGAGATYVVEQGEVIHSGEIWAGPPGAACQLDGQQGVTECALRWNVVGKVGSKRYRSEQLRQSQTLIRWPGIPRHSSGSHRHRIMWQGLSHSLGFTLERVRPSRRPLGGTRSRSGRCRRCPLHRR